MKTEYCCLTCTNPEDKCPVFTDSGLKIAQSMPYKEINKEDKSIRLVSAISESIGCIYHSDIDYISRKNTETTEIKTESEDRFSSLEQILDEI